MKALDATFRMHAANAEPELGPQRSVPLHRLVEASRELGILLKARLECLDAPLPLQYANRVDEPWTGKPIRRRERRAIWCDGRLLHHDGPSSNTAARHVQWWIWRSP